MITNESRKSRLPGIWIKQFWLPIENLKFNMASSKWPKWLRNTFKFQRTEKAEYASLPTASDQEEYTDRSSSSSSLPLYSPEKESSEQRPSNFAKWLLLASLIATTLSFLFFLRKRQRVVTDMACVENMSAYCKIFPKAFNHKHILWLLYSTAPLREAIEYEWVQFPDDFVPDQYSGYPTQESEDEWAKLWDCEFFLLPMITPVANLTSQMELSMCQLSNCRLWTSLR